MTNEDEILNGKEPSNVTKVFKLNLEGGELGGLEQDDVDRWFAKLAKRPKPFIVPWRDRA